MSTRRGSSLVELIISFGIFMAILTATFSILQPGLVAFRTSLQRSDAENESLLALQKLMLELQSSDLQVLTLLAADGTPDSNAPVATVVYLSGGVGDQIQLDPTGFVLLNHEVAWFVAGDPQSQTGLALWRREVALATPVIQAPAPSNVPVAGTNTDRLILHNCQSFQVSSLLSTPIDQTSVLRTNPITIDITTLVNGRANVAESSVSMLQNSVLDPQP